MPCPSGAARKAATAASRLKLSASSSDGEIASQYHSTPLGAGARPAMVGAPGVRGVLTAVPAAAGAEGDESLGAPRVGEVVGRDDQRGAVAVDVGEQLE